MNYILEPTFRDSVGYLICLILSENQEKVLMADSIDLSYSTIINEQQII